MAANLHDAIGTFVASIANAKTAKAYGRALVQFEKIAPLDLASVDETFLMPFADTMKGKASATRDLSLGAVISFFVFLVYTRQSETVSLDRARLIKRKLGGRKAKRISNYPMQELQTLLDYARDKLNHHTPPYKHYSRKSILDLRDRALILTLAETGLRKAEAVSLKLSDVDLEQGQAVVIGKGDKQAVVYFGPNALQAIRKYIESRPGIFPDSPLFARHGRGGTRGTKTTEHLEGTSLNALVNRRACEALGHGISVHSLRHYFITTVWRNTHDLMLAKELARHESVETTVRYTHVDNDALKDAHRRVFA